MPQVQVLRIVVASPGDVQAERNALPAIVDELNHGIARDHGLRLELARWETDAFPGFHPEGPQGLIDSILHIEDCDLLIGIFWKRFGTPVKDAQSGTEHEFRRAYEAWKQQRRPQMMMYFNQKAYMPKTKAETDQWGQVLEFQRHFPKEGLWWPYRGKAQFERLVRNHLTQFTRQQMPNASEPHRASPERIVPAQMQQRGSGAVALGPGATAVGQGGVAVGGNVCGDITIAASATPELPEGLRESYLNWLIEQVRAVPLTGVDPKSIREESRRDLDLAAVYTALLTQRPEATAERELRQDRELRRLSALAVLNAEPRLALLGDPGSGKSTFVNFVALCMAGEILHRPEANMNVLKAPVPDDDAARRRGTDEPPQPQPWDHGPLIPIRVILREFVARGLPASGRTVVERWYAYVGQARGLSADEAQGRALLLNEAITRNPRLYELAARPLLLTLMASLHAWRGGTLPDQREQLYADAVDLLVDQWESQKLKRRPDGTHKVIEPSLVEWLRVDQKAMRQLLNRLAFVAHRYQPTLVGTADIPQDTLVSGLMHLNLNPDVRPARLIEYLRDRAGLLEPRGVGIYAFPHRTFQEYLAACHLTDFGFPDELADLLRGEPNRWREVTLLAGAKAARGTASAAWTLAEALCFADPPTRQAKEEAGYWGVLLAAQALIENRSLEHIAERNRPKVERIRQWLTCTLRHGVLPPVDCSQAGNALATIGDPRFRADAWYLPEEPLLGFVEIPAGPFRMGSKKGDPLAYDDEVPQHEITLPRYYIARYPVTVAQFRGFVEESGYKPADEGSLRRLPNHPVVGVTWYEALKYCEWLTERLREWKATPRLLATLLRQEGWYVTLPSETEWEKAARGPDGKTYPWGNEPDPNRANYEDTRINTTSPVGCFPHGASPYGVRR